MTSNKRSNAITMIVVLMLGLLGGFFAGSRTTEAQAQTSVDRYSYFHFTAGRCGRTGPIGQGVIDLRNGNLWCVPSDGGAPIFEGTLNLATVPERAPGR